MQVNHAVSVIISQFISQWTTVSRGRSYSKCGFSQIRNILQDNTTWKHSKDRYRTKRRTRNRKL